MTEKRLYTVIGLMSGTSLDGIDAALIRTDGRDVVEMMDFMTIPYDPALRDELRACLGYGVDPDGRVARAEKRVTDAHADAVRALMDKAHIGADHVDLIGFHGQTIFHDPDHGRTWQIGDGAALARQTGITIINDFRSADMKAGGQGAPLIPLYHAALAAPLDKPAAILNIGGVANVTYIDAKENIVAFDTGPGNALIDDWVHRHTGADCDVGGALAGQGTANTAVLNDLLRHSYFAARPPKSLDRNAWNISALDGLSPADGAATLTAFTAQSVACALRHLPEKPTAWYVTGGGRHNPAIMRGLKDALGVPVYPVDAYGWNGDALEAQGFAYLAVRSHLKLPLSMPTTTGVKQAVTGGREWSP